VHTGFKVSIARKHSTCHDVLISDSFRHRSVQFSRVTNASHATISSVVEAEVFKTFFKSTVLKIGRHNLRAGRKSGLNIGSHLESLSEGIFGQKTSLHHDIGVGSVSA